MARQRSRGKSKSTESSTVPDSLVVEARELRESLQEKTNTHKERVTKMATVLSMDEISGLLANTRGRGEYATYMSEFIASGEPGWKVDLDSGILAGKSIEKAYTGLNNARTAENVQKDANGDVVSRSPKVPGADKVKVVKSPDKDNPAVFLINRALVEGGAADDSEE